MSGQVALVTVLLPPSEEHCFAGLCGQRACCDLQVRVAGTNPNLLENEEEVYLLPMCDAHALNVMPSLLEMARKMYPADEVEAPPWEQEDKPWTPDPRSHPDWFGDDVDA